MNKSSKQCLQVGRPVAQPVPTVPTLAILQVVGMHISYSGGVCIIEKVRYVREHKRGIHHSKRNNCNSRVQKTVAAK